MTGSTSTLLKAILAMALVIAAFVPAPAADAAICGPEVVASHVVIEKDDTGHDGKAGSHGACAHGHCHHAAAERAPLFDMADTQPLDGSGHARPANDVAPSTSADGLKRPPRG